VLVVVAHPDDEVLGCGATLAKLANTGIPTQACILAGDAEVRAHRPDLPELREDTLRAQQILGLPSPILGPFPNIRLNTVAHIELVQFIEEAIVQTRATLVLTHHPGDLNDDHLQTSRACQAAVRLFQRRTDLPRLRGLYFMEIPSATDWALTPSPAFRPTAFCEIGPEMLDLKIRALRSYRGVMRPYPHPRSDEVLRGLAYCRGAQAGLNMAEAFEAAFSVLEW
jgi:LmbE family N-acetylglucosaminyl deacetylase